MLWIFIFCYHFINKPSCNLLLIVFHPTQTECPWCWLSLSKSMSLGSFHFGVPHVWSSMTHGASWNYKGINLLRVFRWLLRSIRRAVTQTANHSRMHVTSSIEIFKHFLFTKWPHQKDPNGVISCTCSRRAGLKHRESTTCCTFADLSAAVSTR